MPKHYTEEFKKEAVNLVLEHGYSSYQAAQRLGINSKNIDRWIKKAMKKSEKKTKNTKDQEEIIRLRKENDRLRMEKEILKKAAAFFANEKS